MKVLLFTLLICGFVPMSHAAVLRGCATPTGIQLIGMTWRNAKCESCTCGANLVASCAIRLPTPLIFDDDCEIFLDVKVCAYKVVKINDHSIACPYRGMNYLN